MNRSIYLDNAATSHPKPEAVYRAQDMFARAGGNPGRGAHASALDGARRIFDVRLRLAEFLGIEHADRLIFTPGCTHSINMALKGFPFNRGDLVVTGPLEHNSVMRPLAQLKSCHGIHVSALAYSPQGVVDIDEFRRTLRDKRPRLCVIAEASNVTGELVDLQSIAELCNEHSVTLLIDAAQSAGHVRSRVDDLRIDLWCASGHKGLMGTPGVGLLYVSPQCELKPLIAGGTGSRSESEEMPEAHPDHLEAGTLPGPAIAALGAGVQWIEELGIDKIAEREDMLVQRFVQRMRAMPGVRLFGCDSKERTPIVSFLLDGMAPDVVAAVLNDRYGIAVRTGLHCAAQAHRSLGTLSGGLVRAAFGYFNTDEDVDSITEAVAELLRSPARGVL